MLLPGSQQRMFLTGSKQRPIALGPPSGMCACFGKTTPSSKSFRDQICLAHVHEPIVAFSQEERHEGKGETHEEVRHLCPYHERLLGHGMATLISNGNFKPIAAGRPGSNRLQVSIGNECCQAWKHGIGLPSMFVSTSRMHPHATTRRALRSSCTAT
jgi:hypothetical protein